MPPKRDPDSKASISIDLVHDALQCALARGMDRATLLQDANIPLELMASDKARVSIEQFAALWVVLADHLDDEFFAMDSHGMRRGSFKFLSRALLQCSTLKDAIKQMLQFFNLVMDDLQSQLFIQENYAYIVIYDQKETKTAFCYATYIMLIHSLMCWLTGQRIVLHQIQLKCATPNEIRDYQVRFSEQMSFNASDNAVQFDATALNIVIKQDLKSWSQFIQDTPHNLLTRFKNPNALSSQIRKLLSQSSPADWLELHALAQHLHMSEATIQRRLKSEGMSYQQLKNDIRRDRAIELLTQTQQTLQEISDVLSFHDASAFHRAFKNWTGVNPGAYRQQDMTQIK